MITKAIRTKLKEAGYSDDEIRNMNPHKIVDAILTHEGIIGHTAMIEELVLTAYEEVI